MNCQIKHLGTPYREPYDNYPAPCFFCQRWLFGGTHGAYSCLDCAQLGKLVSCYCNYELSTNRPTMAHMYTDHSKFGIHLRINIMEMDTEILSWLGNQSYARINGIYHFNPANLRAKLKTLLPFA